MSRLGIAPGFWHFVRKLVALPPQAGLGGRLLSATEASLTMPEGSTMDEQHFAEIDAALMYIEDARARAERAAADLRRAGAEPHLVAALERAKGELSATQKTLLQRTHFVAPAAQTSF